jgi:signal transduction histidine kinase/ActR/RegA family two-component response regulator
LSAPATTTDEAAPSTSEEAARLSSLFELDILDTPPEEPFERLVALAQRLFNVPCAMISFVDRERVWAKACGGLPVHELPREQAFCSRAILAHDVFTILDARTDPHFVNHPLVEGFPYIHFYAGAQIRTETGQPIGVFCIYDQTPRQAFTPQQAGMLQTLAQIALNELQLRKQQLQLTDLAAQADRAREKAEHCGRVRGEFAAVMAHEVRTPLTSMIGLIDMLRHDPTPATLKETAHTLEVSAQHLLSVVNQILDYSRLEGAKTEQTLTLVALPELVDNWVGVFTNQAAAKKLGIGAIVAPDVPPHVLCDQGRLTQVLANLLGNAIKFTATGGVYLQVGVESWITHDTLILRMEVTDTGPGLTTAIKTKLFMPFARGETEDGSPPRGTGLGLSISHVLVQQMGGEMSLKRSDETGTTFSFTLPVTCPANRPHKRVLPALGGSLVALVVTNTVERLVLRRQLEMLGATVIEAPRPAMAMAICTRSTALRRAVILDHGAAAKDSAPLKALHLLAAHNQVALISVAGTAATSPDGTRELQLPFNDSGLAGLARLMGAPSGAPETATLPAPLPEAPPTARPMQILLVEDHPINQTVISTMLRKSGHEVVVADNGLDAVRAVTNQHFDLVFMDMMMPELDGPATTRLIRQLPAPAGKVRIIALTANVLGMHKAQCLDAEMDDFISKPVTRQQLDELLARHQPGTTS